MSAFGKQAASDLRAIGLAIPQFGKGTYTIEHEMTATFGKNSEAFQLKFKGGWDRYKRYKSITDTFAQEAGELRLTLRVAVEYTEGIDVNGQEFLTMRDVLCDAGSRQDHAGRNPLPK